MLRSRAMLGLHASAIAVVALIAAATAPAASAAVSTAAVYEKPFRTAVRELPVAPENNAGYDRDAQFGDWRDADGDCHDTRIGSLVRRITGDRYRWMRHQLA